MGSQLLYIIRTLPVSILFLFSLSTQSHAEPSYQTEFSADYEKIDIGNTTVEPSVISAEIFFSPVNTEFKPLEEAAFLSKSSSFALKYRQLNYNDDLFDSSGPLIEINYITEASAFIVGAYYFKQDQDTDSAFFTSEYTENGITIGKYLNSSTTINFTYLSSETEARLTGIGRVFSIEHDRYILSYKAVPSSGSNTFYGLGATVELSQSDDGSTKERRSRLNLQGKYYLSRFTGIGASTSFFFSDESSLEAKSLKINATHFFTPQFSFSIGFSKFFTNDEQAEDYDSISYSATARF